MTTPQIPHLKNFRRGGPRGRGRGRGAFPGTRDETREEQTEEEKKDAKDKIVQSTDNDASVSRLSAVDAGYLDDPFARALTTGKAARRYPIINRGMSMLSLLSCSKAKANQSPHQEPTSAQRQLISSSRSSLRLALFPRASKSYHSVLGPTLDTFDLFETTPVSSITSSTFRPTRKRR
jgi:hypothetical protein